MSWKDIDAPRAGGGIGSGSFVKVEDGKTLKFRPLDEEPFTALVHKITAPDKDGKEVFLSVPATENLDDDIVTAATKRFPAEPVFNLRVWVYGEEGGVKILQGGKQIFKPMKDTFDNFGDVRQFDFLLKREGTGRDTKYMVTTSPKAEDVDVEATVAENQTEYDRLDPAAVCRPLTPEEQTKRVEEAGVDLTFDPATALMETMTEAQAEGTVLSFGKYKNKTVGEIRALDFGWLEWAAANVTSNDAVAAAARLVVGIANGTLEAKTPVPQIAAPAEEKKPAKAPAAKKNAPIKPAAAKAPAAAKPAAKDDGATRQSLMSTINAGFESKEVYQDALEIVNAVKVAGNGKTRVKDLTIDELTSLAQIVSEA